MKHTYKTIKVKKMNKPKEEYKVKRPEVERILVFNFDNDKYQWRKADRELNEYIDKTINETVKEIKENSWVFADDRGIEVHADSLELKKVLSYLIYKVEEMAGCGNKDHIPDPLLEWLIWRVTPDEWKPKPTK
jgi:hypothetical protein